VVLVLVGVAQPQLQSDVVGVAAVVEEVLAAVDQKSD